MPNVSARGMIGAIILIFVIAILGAAFTTPLQNQVTSWSDNLTTNGQTTAAAVVSLIPLLFWVLLAVGIILVVVEMFLGSEHGL
jgi:type III secretory pathway component EscU